MTKRKLTMRDVSSMRRCASWWETDGPAEYGTDEDEGNSLESFYAVADECRAVADAVAAALSRGETGEEEAWQWPSEAGPWDGESPWLEK